MTKLKFIAVWEKMTRARKGAAVEAYFLKTHAGAETVRSDFIDFKYQGESLDIKSHKAVCPKLNKNQIANQVSILWYDWHGACETRDEFQVRKIASFRGEISASIWAACSFSEFSKFVSEYKNKESDGEKNHAESTSRAKKLRDAWAAENLFPQFNQAYEGNNRFLLWKHQTKGMQPAILNGKYRKFHRTIVIFYKNNGTDVAPNLEIKKWWLFSHDRTADQMKKLLVKHKVDEKYYATQQSFADGIVRKFEGAP
jgi:hypothetical protein